MGSTALALPLLTSPAGPREKEFSVSRAGCAKQPLTKEPLACLALESQPAAGVRGRAAPGPPPPVAQPRPHCRPALHEHAPAPGPAVPSLTCPCGLGQTHPERCPGELAGPRCPWVAGALFLMATPRCGLSSGVLRAAPQNRPSGQPLEGPDEGARGRGRGRAAAPEPRALLQCSCSSPQTWAGTASCTWRRSAAAGSAR